MSIEVNDRACRFRNLALRGNDRRSQFFHSNIEMAGQRFGSAAAVGHVLAERSKSAAGTNHWILQSAGSGAVAKFQAVCHHPLDAEMLCQRTHHVLRAPG